MKKTGVFVLGVVAAMSVCCHGARILGIFPSQSRSHIMTFTSLTTELARRGHHLTVISTYPQQEPIANYTDIAVPYLFGDLGVDDLNLNDVVNGSVWKSMTYLIQLTPRFCNGFLGHPKVQQLIVSKETKFDLILLEMFMTECFLGFAHKHDVPVIGLFSQVSTAYITDIVGSPSPYAVVPEPLLGYGPVMSLEQRVVNTVVNTVIKLGRQTILLPYQNTFMNKYFAAVPNLPYVEKLTKKICFLFINNDISYSYARSYLPNVVEIGGIHIKPPKPLPEDIKQLLDGAKDGAVYFSFGSTITNHHMNKPLQNYFLQAFFKLKQPVLINWHAPLKEAPAHIISGKWLPQSDILAHPNLRVFVSHGGALSIQEATYRGVPVVGIPIFADEEQNIRGTVRLGFGLMLHINNVTEESLTWAIQAVLNDSRYRKNAKKQSVIFRDQISTPLQRAVYWTEYVLRYKGAPHLQSHAREVNWLEYYSVDVFLVLILTGSLFILIVFSLLKKGREDKITRRTSVKLRPLTISASDKEDQDLKEKQS